MQSKSDIKFKVFELEDNCVVYDVNNVVVFQVDKSIGRALGLFGTIGITQKAIQESHKQYGVELTRRALEIVNELYSIDGVTQELEFNQGVSSVFLNVAHGCNLRCSYCYADSGSYGDTYDGSEMMTVDAAKAALDFLFKHSPDDVSLTVNFFGGEPLLNLSVIKDAVRYGKEKQKITGKKITFGITTNATLVNEEFLDFIKKHEMQVLVSLDGDEKGHNAARKDALGSGTYEKTLRGARQLLEHNPSVTRVRATLSNLHHDLYGATAHLIDLGFSSVSVGFVSDPPTYRMRPKQWEEMKADYSRIIDLVIEKLRSENRFINFLEFTDDVARLYAGRKIYHCGAGRWMRAIDPRGDIYPCQRFIGLEEYKLGSVYKGEFNHHVLELFHDRNVQTNPACSICWVRYLCGGGCPHVNLMVNGDMNQPDESICNWFRFTLSETIKKMGELSNSGESDIIRRIYEEGGGLKISDVHS